MRLKITNAFLKLISVFFKVVFWLKKIHGKTNMKFLSCAGLCWRSESQPLKKKSREIPKEFI
jgi:hypothetical protein